MALPPIKAPKAPANGPTFIADDAPAAPAPVAAPFVNKFFNPFPVFPKPFFLPTIRPRAANPIIESPPPPMLLKAPIKVAITLASNSIAGATISRTADKPPIISGSFSNTGAVAAIKF